MIMITQGLALLCTISVVIPALTARSSGVQWQVLLMALASCLLVSIVPWPTCQEALLAARLVQLSKPGIPELFQLSVQLQKCILPISNRLTSESYHYCFSNGIQQFHSGLLFQYQLWETNVNLQFLNFQVLFQRKDLFFHKISMVL